MHEYKLVEEVAALEDFMRLRKVSGLSERPRAMAETGLQNSLYGVHITFGNAVVGMGRVVGDGGLNFDLVDIAVDPQHQGNGLGRKVMESLMSYLKSTAAPGAYVTLMADVPALYEKFGFKFSRPDTEGMYYDWNSES